MKNRVFCWVCRKGKEPYLSYRCLFRPMAFDGVFPWWNGKHLVIIVNGVKHRGCK